MKKLVISFFLILFLSGCAAYKFSQGRKPYEQGYVVSRSGYTIKEYTLGRDNSVPADINIAKDRFQRRKETVERYYKQMGYIEEPIMTFWNYPVMCVEFVAGQFRLPFVALSDYKYAHNPQYREKVDRIEQEKLAKESLRINRVKEELSKYIQKDLESEQLLASVSATKEIEAKPAFQEKKAKFIEKKAPATKMKPPPVVDKKKEKEEKKKQAALKKAELEEVKREKRIATALKKYPKEKVKAKERPRQVSSGEPTAIIIAKPKKGYSPLAVHFYGRKSYSRGARIIAYSWDFGDGDASTKANPVNKYYSMSFEPKTFTVTLTVNDDKGNTATTSTTIEVLNK